MDVLMYPEVELLRGADCVGMMAGRLFLGVCSKQANWSHREGTDVVNWWTGLSKKAKDRT